MVLDFKPHACTLSSLEIMTSTTTVYAFMRLAGAAARVHVLSPGKMVRVVATDDVPAHSRS